MPIKNGNIIPTFYFVCSTIWRSLHNFENDPHLFLKMILITLSKYIR